MEQKSLLLSYSQEPVTGLSPEPDESNPHPSHISELHRAKSFVWN
jgi:hypothetical protein